MKQLSIIIPTFEREEIFEQTLKTVQDSITHIEAEIIVVNDSKRKEINLVESKETIIVNNKKKGVASARNYGASLASSNNLVFLDDDMLLSPDSIDKLLSYFQKKEKAFFLMNWVYPQSLDNKLQHLKFGRYLLRYNFTSLKGWLGEKWKEGESIVELEMGASYCLPIKKTDFDEIGGYNEDFPHAGAEDYEFFSRAIQRGFKIYLDKTMTITQNEKDRLSMENWLQRKKRNGETIALAVSLGYEELSFNYNWIKKTTYPFFYSSRNILLFFYSLIPNTRLFDPLSFRVINTLLGTYLYQGYHSRRPVV